MKSKPDEMITIKPKEKMMRMILLSNDSNSIAVSSPTIIIIQMMVITHEYVRMYRPNAMIGHWNRQLSSSLQLRRWVTHFVTDSLGNFHAPRPDFDDRFPPFFAAKFVFFKSRIVGSYLINSLTNFRTISSISSYRKSTDKSGKKSPNWIIFLTKKKIVFHHSIL